MINFPITNSADQTFSTVLDGRRVSLRLRYNPSNERWSLDLSIDQQPVLHGQKIVTGIDILKAYNFGVGVIFALGTTQGDAPNQDNLADGRVRLFHASGAEVAAL